VQSVKCNQIALVPSSSARRVAAEKHCYSSPLFECWLYQFGETAI